MPCLYRQPVKRLCPGNIEETLFVIYFRRSSLKSVGTRGRVFDQATAVPLPLASERWGAALVSCRDTHDTSAPAQRETRMLLPGARTVAKKLIKNSAINCFVGLNDQT